MTDNVNHPEHYTKGGIECIDAINASMSNEEFAGYLKGNALKYLWRYRHKKNALEDLKKAMWYLTALKIHIQENKHELTKTNLVDLLTENEDATE